jgi:hypothetical protein
MDEPARRVGRWLLEGPAVVDRGPNAGAVVGWVDEAGQAPFVYPEICGYHLSWLAWLSEHCPEHHDEIATCAEGLLDWLEGHDARHGRFVTRIYDAPQDDWRNLAEFTFDLGMILRGLDAIELALPGLARPDLRGRCCDRIVSAAIPEGRLGSHRLASDETGDELPLRWSTTPGPHLLKVAAALLADPNAAGIAGATISFHRAALDAAEALPPPHPALYAVEGLLEAGLSTGNDAWLASAATLWRRIVDREVRAGGLPAPGQLPAAEARSDVLAQTLRAGRLLVGIGRTSDPTPGFLDHLEAVLAAAIRDDGALPFHYAAAAGSRQDSTWAAQFAHQALTCGDDHVGIVRLI